MLFAFIDTNALLHFPPMADVDWCDVCGTDAVTIVLCVQVLDELDKHKNTPRLAERASKRIKEIKEFRGKKIGRMTFLEVYPASIRSSEFPPTLNPEKSDDQIVFSALKYAQEQTTEVAIITEDMAMTVRAEAHQLRVIAPPENRRLPSPMSDEQKEIQRLERELRDITQRQPHLDVTLEPVNEAPLVLQRRYLVDVPKTLNLLEQQILKKNPMANVQAHLVRQYLEKLRPWFENQNAVTDESSRTFSLIATIRNSGKAPANGVDLKIKFPKSITAFCYEFWLDGDRTKPMRRPLPEWGIDDAITHPVSPVPHNLELIGNALPLNGRIASREFLMTYPVLAHGDERRFSPFYLMFDSWENVRKIAADIHIRTLDPPNDQRYAIPLEIKEQKIHRKATG